MTTRWHHQTDCQRHSLPTSWWARDCWSPNQPRHLDWSSSRNTHQFRKNLKLSLIRSPFSNEPLQSECSETWSETSLFKIKKFERNHLSWNWLKMAKNWNNNNNTTCLRIRIGVASKRGGWRVGQLYTVARPCPSSTQELPRIFRLQSVTGKFPDLSSSTRHPTFRARRRRKHHAHVKAHETDLGGFKKRPNYSHPFFFFKYLISCL